MKYYNINHVLYVYQSTKTNEAKTNHNIIKQIICDSNEQIIFLYNLSIKVIFK